MAKRLNYLEILNRDGLISRTQVKEAQQLAQATGIKLQEALKNSNTSMANKSPRIAENTQNLCRLQDVTIPAILELISESIARENGVLPDEDGETLSGGCQRSERMETLELRFILQRPIELLIASKEAIQEAINIHYGQISPKAPTR